MKIGIFDPYLDDLGGGEKYMMTIAECLSKDHNVSVFWDNKEDLEELKRRFLFNLSSVSIIKNIFSPKISSLERLIKTRKFDAIFVLSDGSIPLVSSKKLFLHFQQPMEHLKSLSAKTKLKLSRVTSIFCNSHFTKSFIDRTFDVDSLVIHPPVALYPKKTKRENIILNVGRLRVKNVTIKGVPIEDYKKQSFMIDVFKKMTKKGLSNWKFVVAISVQEDDKKAFESLKKEAHGFPIQFIVNRNNIELWNLYNQAKVYWHATGYGENLKKHPEYAEHFGISTVEAMGGGAVPVVINAGGQKEIVENNVSGFLWTSEKEFIEKTERLINDHYLWIKMSKEAVRRSKRFSKDRFYKKVRELL